jgi:hypothetical protein
MRNVMMKKERHAYGRHLRLGRFFLASIVALCGLAWVPVLTVHAADSAASAPADAAPAAAPAEGQAILTPAPPGAAPVAPIAAPATAADTPGNVPASGPTDPDAAPVTTDSAAAPKPVGSVAGQDADAMEVLIIQALDQPTDLKVQDVPIRQALDQLAANTGIPIRLTSGCVSFLPYGSQTKLTATIEKRPLRESLTALLRPLGLEFVAGPKEVTVQPTPPLVRMGRRATWEELATLEKLLSQPMTPELFGTLRFQFQDTGGEAVSNHERLGKAIGGVGEGVAARVLDHACERCGWTWYPEGQVVAILSKIKYVKQQVDRRVTVRYVQASLTGALTDLANRAGVLLRFDPGVLNSLPAQTTERFSLSMENATVWQALEVVSGETGLMPVIEADGVRITRQGAAGIAGAPATNTGGANTSQIETVAQATAAAMRSNSIVGQFTFPLPDGSSFSFFVRESDLPPELAAMRQAKIAKTVNQIRQKLHGEQQQD